MVGRVDLDGGARNAMFVAPNGWVGEITSQATAGGFVTFEYVVWQSQDDKDKGLPPYLVNDHKAQVRETHQRIVTDVAGKLLHRGDGATRVALAADEVEAFIEADARASRWTSDQKRLDEWTDQAGRKLAPFVFKTYTQVDEPLDPQWVRETYALSIEAQVEALIFDALARFEAGKRSGDLRGTTLNLQVGADAADVRESSAGAVSIDINNLSVDGAGEFVGMRFLSVTVPVGATINTAVWSCVPTSGTQDEPLVTVAADDADSAAAFTTGAGTFDVSGRSDTTANVTWSNTDLGADGATFFSAPDIAAVIAEVTARAGWASGNAIAIIIGPGQDGARDLIMTDYAQNTALAGKLDIDYTAAAAGAFNPYFYRQHIARMA